MQELTFEQVEEVSGGTPAHVVIGAVAGYMAIIDYAIDFGHGLGSGLYDALH